MRESTSFAFACLHAADEPGDINDATDLADSVVVGLCR
jgi:hypothetical protein